jgi:hypothetical protein
MSRPCTPWGNRSRKTAESAPIGYINHRSHPPRLAGSSGSASSLIGLPQPERDQSLLADQLMTLDAIHRQYPCGVRFMMSVLPNLLPLGPFSGREVMVLDQCVLVRPSVWRRTPCAGYGNNPGIARRRVRHTPG